MHPQRIIDRFWSHVDRSGDCWPWTAHCARNGYGIFAIKYPNKRLAHRFAWEAANGAIPDGLDVLHRCDNPPCCRPEHLWLGTDSDNQRDRVAKGKLVPPHLIPRGERTGAAKLTDAGVRDIRLRYAAGGISQDKLAAEFSVSQAVISKVIRRTGWSHIE